MNENVEYYLVETKEKEKEYIKVLDADKSKYSRKIVKEIYDVKMGEVIVSDTIELPSSYLAEAPYFKKITYKDYIESVITILIKETQKTIELLNINILSLNNFIDKERIKNDFHISTMNYKMTEKQIKMFK